MFKELKQIEGGRIDKVYHDGEKIWLRIYASGIGERDLVFWPGVFFISQYKRPSSTEPSSFCMLLRKHLMGQRIIFVRKKGFERIIEIETKDNIIVFEIFSKGNVILCDKEYMILMPMKIQLWKDREILPKKQYKYPPDITNPFSLDFDEFKKMFKSQKKVVTLLATSLALSGKYAEELCKRAGIEKNKKCSELEEEEIRNIFTELKKMETEFKPCIIFENDEPVDFSPFDLKIYEDKEKKFFSKFSEVVDEFFTYWERKEVEREVKEGEETLQEKIKRIVTRQKEIMKNLKKMEEETRKKAEIIFNNLDLIERIFNGVRKAISSGMKWEEIKERIEMEDSPEARAIKEIREHEGKIILNIDGKDIEVDFTISPVENAQMYYERAKKYKKKLERVEERIKEVKEKLKKERKTSGKKVKIPVKRKTKKNWYEKFRWSLTSEGFLVVAGKDATQNEVLYKKYLEENDIVLHADIPGAPLTIVKSQEKEITPLAIREGAEIAAAYSRAWKMKLGNVDVYWVRPEQVSKTPPSGQYLPKGSFMIYGEKNYLRKTQVKISIGVIINEDAKPYAGSVLGARAHCKYFLTIYPGDVPKPQLVKQIKLKLMQKALPEDKDKIEKIPDDEFLSLLPGDGGEILG